jgi:hypothetical protein
MPERGMRESSVETGAQLRSRGGQFRHQLAAGLLAHPPIAPASAAPITRIKRLRGPLSGSAPWAANPAVSLDPKVLKALASDRDSPFFDSLYGVALRSLEQAGDPARWLERTEPVIVAYRSGRTRVGFFDWTTDRDAFIEALLGWPVSGRPRYEQTGPSLPVRFTGEFEHVRKMLGATFRDSIALYGMSGASAVGYGDVIGRVAANNADGDPVRAELQRAAVQIDPAGFAATPGGRVVLGVVQAAFRWRTPRADLELATTYDLGIGGRIGLAVWGTNRELRHCRAAMSAHLRYLFDYAVAPQNRWPDPRTQREATAIWLMGRLAALAEPGQAVTRPKIARFLRRENPADYEGEDEAATIRRVYRISALIKTSDPP